jgi:hypothetical protein
MRVEVPLGSLMGNMPNYFQYEDLDNRFARKLHFYLTDKEVIYLAKTESKNWYAICKLANDGKSLDPIWEVYLRRKYITGVHDLLRKWCREHGLAFMGKAKETIPRMERDPKKRELEQMKRWQKLANV